MDDVRGSLDQHDIQSDLDDVISCGESDTRTEVCRDGSLRDPRRKPLAAR
jgi:hypothetical protein